MRSWLATGRRLALSPHLAVVCRVVLGSVFIAAGWSKIGHPSRVIQSVTGFDILPDYLVRPFAVSLPWIELIAGILLVIGLLVPSASMLLAILNSAFLVAIGVALWRGTEVDCGCFGQPEPLTWRVFVRDIGFLAMSLQILAVRPVIFSLQGALSALWWARSQRPLE